MDGYYSTDQTTESYLLDVCAGHSMRCIDCVYFGLHSCDAAQLSHVLALVVLSFVVRPCIYSGTGGGSKKDVLFTTMPM